MPTNQLICLNDFARQVYIGKLNATTFVEEPLTSGTVNGFIATTSTSTAAAANASLSAVMTHTGYNPSGVAEDGWWGFVIDAAVLTKANLDSWLGGTAPRTCYFIVQHDNGVRRYETLTYTDAVEADDA